MTYIALLVAFGIAFVKDIVGRDRLSKKYLPVLVTLLLCSLSIAAYSSYSDSAQKFATKAQLNLLQSNNQELLNEAKELRMNNTELLKETKDLRVSNSDLVRQVGDLKGMIGPFIMVATKRFPGRSSPDALQLLGKQLVEVRTTMARVADTVSEVQTAQEKVADVLSGVQAAQTDARVTDIVQGFTREEPGHCVLELRFKLTNKNVRDRAIFTVNLESHSNSHLLDLGIAGAATNYAGATITQGGKTAELAYDPMGAQLVPLIVYLDKCDTLKVKGSYFDREMAVRYKAQR